MRAIVLDLVQAMVDPVALGLVMGMLALGAQIMLLMVERLAMGTILGMDGGNRHGEQGKGEKTDQTLRHGRAPEGWTSVANGAGRRPFRRTDRQWGGRLARLPANSRQSRSADR